MTARGPGDELKTYPWGEPTNPTWDTRSRDNLSIQHPDGDLYTCAVGKFEAHSRPYKVGTSVLGVVGLAGNVAEWCSDWYGPYLAVDEVNPRGPSAGARKVLRGGDWQSPDYGVVSRCSHRDHHDPRYYKWGTTGFRVAADAR